MSEVSKPKTKSILKLLQHTSDAMRKHPEHKLKLSCCEALGMWVLESANRGVLNTSQGIVLMDGEPIICAKDGAEAVAMLVTRGWLDQTQSPITPPSAD